MHFHENTKRAEGPYTRSAESLTCYCTAVREAAKHLSRLYDSYLSNVGLSVTQFTILRLLYNHGKVTIAELAGALVTDRSAMGRNLKPLEREGLISVKVGTADRRERTVVLTEAGRQRFKESLVPWRKAQ